MNVYEYETDVALFNLTLSDALIKPSVVV